MRSHYPSSTELSAFRRTIDFEVVIRAGFYVDKFDDNLRHVGNYAGAWPHERDNGIGYREAQHGIHSHPTMNHARREASAVRSRAFYNAQVRLVKRLVEKWPDAQHDAHAPHGCAWYTEILDGCPAHFTNDSGHTRIRTNFYGL